MNENNLSAKIKSVRLKSIIYLIFVLCIVLSAVMIHSIINVYNNYNTLATSTEKYILSEEAITKMNSTSDFLTEQTRLYVMTGNIQNVNNYFNEIKTYKSREGAINSLKSNLGTSNEATFTYLEDAIKKSNTLTTLEMHAIRLVAEARGDVDKMPNEIKSYPLIQEELELSPEEKEISARNIVFGKAYFKLKNDIQTSVKGAKKYTSEHTKKEQTDSAKLLHSSLSYQMICSFCVIAIILVFFFIIIELVLKPVTSFVKSIEKDSSLEVDGCQELRYLAETYNRIYRLNCEHKAALLHKVEHDALTGILNREAFEQLKNMLRNSDENIALLLIDVDIFKSINDTYGHDMGDAALKKVASLIKKCFRLNDYPIRIGGDEFAVIMTNITPNKKNIIGLKIDAINNMLQNPDDHLPPLSLSVGIAFSNKGYNDTLYKNADTALYETKKTGRCGYTFYEVGLEKLDA